MAPIEANDYLGILSKHWDIKATLRTHPRNWGAGGFDGGKDSWPDNFGNKIDNVKALLDLGIPFFRVQGWWSKGSHKIAPMDALKRRIPVWQRIAERWSSQKVYFSITCEYSESTTRDELRQRLKLLKNQGPNLVPVLSPLHGAVTLPNNLIERHGPGGCKRGEASSWDGQSCYDYDVRKWKQSTQGAVYRMYWGLRYNLSESIKDENDNPIFIPCPNRTASPDDLYHTSMNVFADPIPVIPVSPFPPGVAKRFTKPNLYKTHAEDMKGDGVRDNRPLIMVKSRGTFANVVACNGQSVCRFDLFPDNKPHELERYYSGLGSKLYGWQIAEIAQRISGSPYVWFVVNQEVWGPVHPSYRAEWFQPLR